MAKFKKLAAFQQEHQDERRRESSLFIQWCWENCIICHKHMHKNEFGPLPHIHKNEFKVGQRPKCKS